MTGRRIGPTGTAALAAAVLYLERAFGPPVPFHGYATGFSRVVPGEAIGRDPEPMTTIGAVIRRPRWS